MAKNVAPKSINRRDRPIPVRLPIETELFYAAQGEFVREASTTRTLEQFLMDRATVPENIQGLAAQIRIRAKILGKTPKQILADFLIEKDYNSFLDAENTADALCLAWGLDPYEQPKST